MRNINPGSSKSNRRWIGFGERLMEKNLTYVFFIAFLGLVYIFNSHMAENHLAKNTKLESEIREAKWEYMSLKSELMKNSRRSEIAKKIEGFESLDEQKQPQKIEVSKS